MLNKSKLNISADIDQVNNKTTPYASMLALLSLFNKYYFKSFFGPFFSGIFPILMLVTLGNLQPIQFIVPGIMGIIPMSVGVSSLPAVIVDFKKSVLMKRIGATPIKRWMFSSVVITYFVFISILTTAWTFLWLVIIYSGKQIDPTSGVEKYTFVIITSSIKWGSFLFAQLLSLVMAMSIGFFIGISTPSATAAGAIGALVSILSNFLSGQLISLNVINGVAALKVISYFIPFRYTNALTVSSFDNINYVNQSIFDLTAAFQIKDIKAVSEMTYPLGEIGSTVNITYKVYQYTLLDIYDKYLNLILPSIISMLTIALSIKFFKWGKTS
jgi:ABC-2 type transport system permease protein